MKFTTTRDDSLVKMPDVATVKATVGIGPRSDQGFGLTVELEVHFPGTDKDEVAKNTGAGHGICPYSHAASSNIPVTAKVV